MTKLYTMINICILVCLLTSLFLLFQVLIISYHSNITLDVKVKPSINSH